MAWPKFYLGEWSGEVHNVANKHAQRNAHLYNRQATW